MARGSSIHFKPVPAGGILAIAHNTREVPPRDLLPGKHHLGNVSIVYGDVEATYREKMALASPKARATMGYSPLQEGVLNLPDPPADHPCAEVDEWKRDMERRVREFCAQYQQVSGHRVLRGDIHLDEGHVREDGSVGYNVHCHICVDKTDERGRVVRLERHEANARTVAAFLAADKRVDWVSFVGFPEHPHFELAQRYLKGRVPSIVTFGVAGGYEAGLAMFNALGLFKRLVNMGDVKSLVAHPASTTHRQLSAAELATAGIRPEMVRLSVGLEHPDDLCADLDQALEVAARDARPIDAPS